MTAIGSVASVEAGHASHLTRLFSTCLILHYLLYLYVE